MHDRAIDIEIANAAVTKPDPAGHLLLHRDLSREIELTGEFLLHLHQARGAAGEERVAASVGNQLPQDAFDIGGTAGRFRIRHDNDIGAVAAEQCIRQDKIGASCRENGCDFDIGLLRRLGRAAQASRDPAPRPTATIWRHAGSSRKPTPSGPITSSLSPGAEQR